jgi:metal-responsive CopG/Arc/MetJ family transcriptional regulator
MKKTNNKETRLVLTIENELKEQYKKLCKKEYMDVSKMTRKLIKDFVEKNKDKLNKLF